MFNQRSYIEGLETNHVRYRLLYLRARAMLYSENHTSKVFKGVGKYRKSSGIYLLQYVYCVWLTGKVQKYLDCRLFSSEDTFCVCMSVWDCCSQAQRVLSLKRLQNDRT